MTTPLNGQYPRPWMTRTTDPFAARVFVVGRNQATTFSAAEVGPQEQYLDALFNRNGASCRRLYDDLRKKSGRGPSPTRRTIDALVDRLAEHGIGDVLETNVICYATPMSVGLALPENTGGRRRGTEVFRLLLGAIEPEVIIAHGAATARDLGRVLQRPLPRADLRGTDAPLWSEPRAGTHVAVIPSLAPPAWNRWADRASDVFDRLAADVARLSGAGRGRGGAS